MYLYSKRRFRLEIEFQRNPRSWNCHKLCLQGCEGCEIRDPRGQSIPHPDSKRGERTHPTRRGGDPGRAQGMRGRQVSQACRSDQFLCSSRMWVALMKNPTLPSALSAPLDTHLVTIFVEGRRKIKSIRIGNLLHLNPLFLMDHKYFQNNGGLLSVFERGKPKYQKS